MGQYSPKSASFFDAHWKPRIKLAAKVLLDAEDAWLLTDEPFPTANMLAVFFWIFRFDFGSVRYGRADRHALYQRSLEDWYQLVEVPAIECCLLLPRASDQERCDVLDAFCEIVSWAADCWLVDPTSPAPIEVATDCADYLGNARVLKVR